MLTNFYPIEVYTPEFDLRSFEYSEDILRSLRDTHNATHSFFRIGNQILCSWMKGDDIDGGQVQHFKEHESPDIVAALIRHLFFRSFIRNVPDLTPLDFYPLRVISRKPEHDAIRDMLPEELKDVVSFKRLNEIQTRRIEVGDDYKFGLLINIRRRWQVSRNLASLQQEGYNLEGCAVVHSEPLPGLEKILAPSEYALGRVLAVDQSQAVVVTTEGRKTIPLEELFLRRSRREIKDYLEFRIGQAHTERILSKVYEMGALAADAKEFHDEIQTLANYFSSWDFRTEGGFAFSVTDNACIPSKSLRVQTPEFIFDIGPGAASARVLSGLIKYGPYDSNRFTPKNPHILVVCRKSYRAGFSRAMGSLRVGIPSSRFFKQGMKDLYRLHDMVFTFAEADDRSADSFIKSIHNAISSGQNRDFHLAVVEGSDDEPESPSENPYYRAKATLMGAGVPVQSLQAQRTRLPDRDLAYILGPLSLQMYAKMGGTPWVLPSSQDVDREIVVGISNIIQRESEFAGGRQFRVVGLTTFFSSDGTFLMANHCQEVPYNEYFNELLSGLENSITNLSQDYAWREQDSVRIVFHIFKPIRETEAEVVKVLIKRFPQFDIRFAFVTIATTHPFLLFDNSQQQNRRGKGYYVPHRGTNQVLSETECLLQTLGKGEIRQDRHGFSHPALVRIHPASTFLDLHHITQQVLNFTHLSWRSFGPTHLPATLLYAELIARMLSRLRGLPEWNPQVVNTILKRKKWFL